MSYNTHGLTHSREYRSWHMMRQRCYNPNNAKYFRYGGRGIEVCESWIKFENFYKDMGLCPPGLTLERKDNDGGYTKDNCIWATKKEQSRNTRRNVWVMINGVKTTVAHAAEQFGLNYNTAQYRIARGIPLDKPLGRWSS